jgi:hypothetical protein
MTRVLHDYKTAHVTNGSIDLEGLFNPLGSVLKPEVESPVDDSPQAAMMAQARIQPKPLQQDKGNHAGPKKKQDTRPGNHEPPRMGKLMQVMYDMKAEMGALRRAFQQAGISVDSPHKRKVLFIFITKKAYNMLCGKGRVRTQDLGYQAERYDHCTTRQVCVDGPYQKNPKEQRINGSQKPKFTGIAKKANRSKNIASRSLVPDRIPQTLSDSNMKP